MVPNPRALHLEDAGELAGEGEHARLARLRGAWIEAHRPTVEVDLSPRESAPRWEHAQPVMYANHPAELPGQTAAHGLELGRPEEPSARRAFLEERDVRLVTSFAPCTCSLNMRLSADSSRLIVPLAIFLAWRRAV
jgi:hypothetical protein